MAKAPDSDSGYWGFDSLQVYGYEVGRVPARELASGASVEPEPTS